MSKVKLNKSILIIVALILIVGIAAALLFKGKGAKNSALTGSGVFNSIEDAISRSLSLKCEYKVGENNTVAYVKGTSVRIEGTWDGKNNSAAIIKDNKLWTWDTTKKEGIVFPLEASETEDKGATSKGIIEGLENEKQFCKVSIFSDTIFDPPTDVKFQDLGNLQNLNVPTPGK